MLLKQMYGQSDEAFADRWIENPYWQYFCGETYFQFEKPFDPSEFVHFRKFLGTDGAEKLLKLNISLFENNAIMAAVAFNMMIRLRQIWDAIYYVLDLLSGYRQVKYVTC